MTIWSELPLTEQHAAYLREQAAITAEVAAAAGIRSARSVDDLPEHARSWGEQAVPAIVFPWTAPDGTVVEQVRPDTPAGDQKYLWPKGVGAVLNTIIPVTEDTETVFVVEGTKQGFAVAGYAPANVAVYGVGGCRNWSTDGLPINDLMVVEGKKVVILLDADAKSNRAVFDAGVELGRACTGEGCTGEPRFVWLPGAKTVGIDDLLSKRPDDKRASYLDQLVKIAVDSKGREKQAKPAATQPKAKVENVYVAPTMATGGREIIYLDGDRLELVNQITGNLLASYNTTRLFCHGDRLSQLKGQEMKPVDEGAFNLILAQAAVTAYTVNDREGNQIGIKEAWPDGTTVKVVMSRADEFAELDLVSRSPFVRPDGTICATNGYDEATRTMVVMDAELEGITVPEHPTADEVAQARKLILDDWLGDFPFPDEANRANALALVITPFVRSMMYVAPLAVVDGLAPGVGKNLLVDCILLMFLGHKPEMLGWNPNDEELRKTITSTFMTGPEVIVFDEAHKLDGPSLARALTAAYWKDRLLGGNNIKGYPNRATWISLGNNVRIEGDIFRRVYQIALRPHEANPENRPTSQFRHPQLEDWTKTNRPELVKAALTLVRAWFSAGKPRPSNGVTFGSFEKWAEVVGGIVETAGQPGFLMNLTAWRSESNLDAGHWTAHLTWLHEKVGDSDFTCREVRNHLLADVNTAEYPPLRNADLDNKATYPKALGEAYHSIRDRSFGGYRIVRPVGVDGKPLEARGGRALWRVVTDTPLRPEYTEMPPDGPEGPEGPAALSSTRNNTHTRGDAGDVCVSRTGDGAEEAPSGPSSASETDEDVDSGQSGTADSGETDDSRLAAPEEPWEGVTQPSLFEEPTQEPEPAEFVEGEVVDLATWSTEADIELLPGTVVFDIESTSERLWPTRPDFIRITGVQQGKTIRVYGDSAEVAQLLREATMIVGHNLMGFDLLAFALHHGVDIHHLAEQGRLIDTMINEILVNPPTARTGQGQIMRSIGLDALGAAKELGAKSHNLKELAAKHGGFDKIQTNDKEYVTYCGQDVNLTAKIGRSQGTPSAYAKREMRVAAMAAQIRMNGFRVDVEENRRRVVLGEELRERRLVELHEQYGLPLPGGKVKAPHMTKIGKQAIAQAFADLGVTLRTTEKGGHPSFGKEAREEIIEQFADRQDVLDLCDTVGSLLGIRTVFATIERCLVGDRVHPDITMFQSSGRWSITEPGITVMGKRGGKYTEREVFLPEPGHVIIAADLSQVDARVVAALSQDEGYFELFGIDPTTGKPRDMHAEVALAALGSADLREDAKALGHGWNYGMGIPSLTKKIGDEGRAREFDRGMRNRYPRLVTWKQDSADRANAGQLLDNGWGRKLRTTPGKGFTQGPALLGQSGARDILMQGLLRMPAEYRPWLRAVIHDEIVLSVPENRVEEISAGVVSAMSFEWAPQGIFPLTGEPYRPIEIKAECSPPGANWGAVYAK